MPFEILIVLVNFYELHTDDLKTKTSEGEGQSVCSSLITIIAHVGHLHESQVLIVTTTAEYIVLLTL